MSDAMDHIGGQAWTVREMFGRRYLVDTYQRDYAWKKDHLQDLINDLSRRFLAQRRPEHETRDVAGYEPYFLGPVITHRQKDRTYIVDGQQRMTTLMLLLMWLHRLQSDRDDAVSFVNPLVVSDDFGKLEFAVEDPLDPRAAYLDALLAGREINSDEPLSPSVRNLIARFGDIDELFPADLRDDDLPSFIYWLLGRVLLVEISTRSGRLALESFETMNDRGLRLSSTDKLKSFVLQHADAASHAPISQTWRARLSALTEAESNGASAFMKNWLRAKYSRHTSDDEELGGAVDRWVRDNHQSMGLLFPRDFRTFVDDMDRLSQRYLTLLEAARRPQPRLDAVYFNGINSVTLQYPLILAAVTPDDDKATFLAKAAMVSGYLDILVARRMVNERDYRYDSLARGVFALGRDIRNLDKDALARRLGEEVAAIPEGFDGVLGFTLRHGNRARAKHLLSRITAWLEVNVDASPTPPTQAEAVHKLRYFEMEHIWANHPEYQPEVPARRFQAVRNRLGALVLLPKDFNASFGDERYETKVERYVSQNLLARSLHRACYEANPSFLRLLDNHRLAFRAFESFDEAAIEQRQKLYRRLCELVWDPQQYGLVVPLPAASSHKTERVRTHFGVSIGQLIHHGSVPAGARLVGSHRGIAYAAQLTADGHITVESGETFESPSAAAAAVLDRPSWPGWTFWRVALTDGTTPTLDAIRKTALRQALLG